jgi:hypothetical protein
MIRRRLTLAGFLTLLLTTVGVATVAGPASAIPDPPTFYSGHVYNGGSPRCLDSGIVTNAQLWTCSSSPYQQWTYSPRPAQRAIRGNAPSGCLDDGAGLNGSGVFLTSCNGSLHQKWDLYGGLIVNAASGRCLDADLGTIGGQGTKVQVWDCSGGSNQQWAFEFEP